MEKGAQFIVYMLVVAILLGVMVIVFQPSYRGAARALFRKQPAQSPLWISNLDYYPEVGLAPGSEGPHAE